jgi:hypothetical protein
MIDVGPLRKRFRLGTMLLQHELFGCCGRLLKFFVIPTADEILDWMMILL